MTRVTTEDVGLLLLLLLGAVLPLLASWRRLLSAGLIAWPRAVPAVLGKGAWGIGVGLRTLGC